MDTRSLKERDKQVIWHPFDQMKGADILPIVKGDGAVVFDEEGNEYIDAFASWWVNVHGHAHPTIAEAIAKQAKKLEHIAFGGFSHPEAIELSERLVEVLPDTISKIFFSDNGSTANEVALKMSIQYWFNQGQKRNTFISLENDYHGDTFGSMSLTARGGFNEPFERFMFDVNFVQPPTKENREEVLSHFRSILEKGDVAAFIFEPLVQGAAGMLMYDAEILDEMIGLCKEYEVLTIADEVFTGFGRTGKMFAMEHLTNKPDIMCLSKGITGGFVPLGITAVAEKVYQAFYSDDAKHTFLHGHSYTGNAIACAAANASLKLFEEEATLDKVDYISKKHKQFIQKVNGLKNVRAARSLGPIAAIEINNDKASSYFNSVGKEAAKFFRDNGVLMRPLGNVIVIIPPFCITEEQLEKVYKVTKEYLG